jgi:hypothetical protein
VPGLMELKPYLTATETVSEETCEVAAIRVRNIVACALVWGPQSYHRHGSQVSLPVLQTHQTWTAVRRRRDGLL